jgi:uncharacterized protein YbcI
MDTASAELSGGKLAAAISSMVVGVYADHLGRGPTKARSHIAAGVVTCVLEDTLTRAERTLVEAGQPGRVTEMRCALQETLRGDLAAGVERLSERQVVEVVGGDRVEADVSVQVFLLGTRSQRTSEAAPANGRVLATQALS